MNGKQIARPNQTSADSYKKWWHGVGSGKELATSYMKTPYSAYCVTLTYNFAASNIF